MDKDLKVVTFNIRCVWKGYGDGINSFVHRAGMVYEVTDKIAATFHNWGKKAVKIDYIFATKSIKNSVKSVYIWDDCDEGIYLSDHYPVCMEFDIKNI